MSGLETHQPQLADLVALKIPGAVVEPTAPSSNPIITSLLNTGDSRIAIGKILEKIGKNRNDPVNKSEAIRNGFASFTEFASDKSSTIDNGIHMYNVLLALRGISGLREIRSQLALPEPDSLTTDLKTCVNSVVSNLKAENKRLNAEAGDKKDNAFRLGFYTIAGLNELQKTYPELVHLKDDPELQGLVDSVDKRFSSKLPLPQVMEILFGHREGNYRVPGLVEAPMTIQEERGVAYPFRERMNYLEDLTRRDTSLDLKIDVINLLCDALDNRLILNNGYIETADSKLLYIMQSVEKHFEAAVAQSNAIPAKDGNYPVYADKICRAAANLNRVFCNMELNLVNGRGKYPIQQPGIFLKDSLYRINRSVNTQLEGNSDPLPVSEWYQKDYFTTGHNHFEGTIDTAMTVKDIRSSVDFNNPNNLFWDIKRIVESRRGGNDNQASVRDALKCLPEIMDMIEGQAATTTEISKLINALPANFGEYIASLRETDPFYYNQCEMLGIKKSPETGTL